MNESSSILLVDDDPMILRMGSTLLTRAGYRVRTASSGEDAMQAIRDEYPGILVTDWMMPGMTGIDLCRALREMEREINRHVYTIMLTALGDPDNIVEAFDAGADDYLSKPIHSRELVARVGAGARLVTLKQRLNLKERELQYRNAELEVAYAELTKANERLDHMALTDELTDLPNRRAAMQTADARWEEVTRHGGPLACVMMDLDHFKSINDTWGHEVGDEVLRQTAAVLRRTTRGGERVFRFGGEEFLLLCPNSGSEAAIVGAERIRSAIESMEVLVDGERLDVTMSLGVADRTPDMESFNDLLKAADEALYRAKHAGRNRVWVSDVESGMPPSSALAGGEIVDPAIEQLGDADSGASDLKQAG